MTQDTQDNVTKIGTGGRLYADARKQAEDREAGAVPPHRETLGKPKKRAETPPPSVVVPKVIPVPKEPRDWQQLTSTLVELLGITALTMGFWMLRPWAGLIVLGLCLMVVGFAYGLPTGKGTKGT